MGENNDEHDFYKSELKKKQYSLNGSK